MIEQNLSQEDIESLADRLAALEPQLSEPQRALLAGLLRLAGEGLSDPILGGDIVSERPGGDAPVVVEVADAVPQIRQAFLDAFTPGRTASQGGAASRPILDVRIGTRP